MGTEFLSKQDFIAECNRRKTAGLIFDARSSNGKRSQVNAYAKTSGCYWDRFKVAWLAPNGEVLRTLCAIREREEKEQAKGDNSVTSVTNSGNVDLEEKLRAVTAQRDATEKERLRLLDEVSRLQRGAQSAQRFGALQEEQAKKLAELAAMAAASAVMSAWKESRERSDMAARDEEKRLASIEAEASDKPRFIEIDDNNSPIRVDDYPAATACFDMQDGTITDDTDEIVVEAAPSAKVELLFPVSAPATPSTPAPATIETVLSARERALAAIKARAASKQQR